MLDGILGAYARPGGDGADDASAPQAPSPTAGLALLSAEAGKAAAAPVATAAAVANENAAAAAAERRRSSRSDAKPAASSQRTFPYKLYAMLEHAATADSDHGAAIISWTDDGRGFFVRDQRALELQLLPRFFKATKYRSFTRQLNLWGFQRSCTRTVGKWEHPHFVRGDLEGLSAIERVEIAGTGKGWAKKAVSQKKKGGNADQEKKGKKTAKKRNLCDDVVAFLQMRKGVKHVAGPLRGSGDRMKQAATEAVAKPQQEGDAKKRRMASIQSKLEERLARHQLMVQWAEPKTEPIAPDNDDGRDGVNVRLSAEEVTSHRTPTASNDDPTIVHDPRASGAVDGRNGRVEADRCASFYGLTREQAVGLVGRGRVYNVEWEPGSIRTIYAAHHYVREKSVPQSKREMKDARESVAQRITPLGFFSWNRKHRKIHSAVSSASFKKAHPRIHRPEWHAPRPGEKQTKEEKLFTAAVVRFRNNPDDPVFQWHPPRTIGPLSTGTLRGHLPPTHPAASNDPTIVHDPLANGAVDGRNGRDEADWCASFPTEAPGGGTGPDIAGKCHPAANSHFGPLSVLPGGMPDGLPPVTVVPMVSLDQVVNLLQHQRELFQLQMDRLRTAPLPPNVTRGNETGHEPTLAGRPVGSTAMEETADSASKPTAPAEEPALQPNAYEAFTAHEQGDLTTLLRQRDRLQEEIAAQKGRHRLPAFPLSLTHMLESVEELGLAHIVCWSEDEKGFLIRDEDAFLADVLPRFFKSRDNTTSKMLSFRRKLNRWGFRQSGKRISNKDWRHPKFNRTDAVVAFAEALTTGTWPDFLGMRQATRPGKEQASRSHSKVPACSDATLLRQRELLQEEMIAAQKRHQSQSTRKPTQPEVAWAPRRDAGSAQEREIAVPKGELAEVADGNDGTNEQGYQRILLRQRELLREDIAAQKGDGQEREIVIPKVWQSWWEEHKDTFSPDELAKMHAPGKSTSNTKKPVPATTDTADASTEASAKAPELAGVLYAEEPSKTYAPLPVPSNAAAINLLPLPGENGGVCNKGLLEGKHILLTGSFPEVSSDTSAAHRAITNMLEAFGATMTNRCLKSTAYMLVGKFVDPRKVEAAKKRENMEIVNLNRMQRLLRGELTIAAMSELPNLFRS